MIWEVCCAGCGEWYNYDDAFPDMYDEDYCDECASQTLRRYATKLIHERLSVSLNNDGALANSSYGGSFHCEYCGCSSEDMYKCQNCGAPKSVARSNI